MKFTCDKCHTKYSISDEKVKGKVLKIRCKNCSNIMVVREQKSADDGGAKEKKPNKSLGLASLAKKEEKRRVLQGPFGGPRQGGAAPALKLASQPASQPKGANAFLYQPTTLSVPPGFSKDEPPIAEEWYLSVDGNQFGPMEFSELGSRIKRGEAPSDAYVWQDGFADWKPIADVPDLSSFVPRTPPPPPKKQDSGLAELAGSALGAAPVEQTPVIDDNVPSLSPSLGSSLLDDQPGFGPGPTAGPDRLDPGPSLESLLGETPGSKSEPESKPDADQEDDSLSALLGLATGASAADKAADHKPPPAGEPLAEAKPVVPPAGLDDKPDEPVDEPQTDEPAAAVVPPVEAAPDAPGAPPPETEEDDDKAAAPLPMAVGAAVAATPAPPAPPTPMAMKLAAGGGIIAALAGVFLVVYFMAFDKGPQPPPNQAAASLAPKASMDPSPSLPVQTDDATDEDKELSFEPEELSRTKGHERTVKMAKKAAKVQPKNHEKELTKEQKRLAALFGSKGVAKPTAAIPTNGSSATKASGPKQQIGPSQILSMQRKYKKSLKVCYERALKRDDSLAEAKAEVTLDVGLSGMVKKATVGGVSNYQLKSCLHRVVKRWYFANAGEQTIKFPLIFRGAN